MRIGIRFDRTTILLFTRTEETRYEIKPVPSYKPPAGEHQILEVQRVWHWSTGGISDVDQRLKSITSDVQVLISLHAAQNFLSCKQQAIRNQSRLRRHLACCTAFHTAWPSDAFFSNADIEAVT